MQIRRKLAALAAPLLIIPAVLAASATTANAAITATCNSPYSCQVYEDMGSGYCQAVIQQTDANAAPNPSGSFADATGTNYLTGYSCNFILQRNVNNTGWYDIGTFSVPTSGSVIMPNEWNGPGYQAQVCLQFNWGSSLGDVHCSGPVHIS